MTLEAAPTPCRRTGFHISTISWCAACAAACVGVVASSAALLHATCVAALVQVGSMMIKSPGLAASIAAWIEPDAATCVGDLPPMVTVTVSIDCWPFAAVICSWPHCAVEPPYCACCCTAQLGTPGGTVTVIEVSLQAVTGALIPPIVTLPLPWAAPKP